MRATSATRPSTTASALAMPFSIRYSGGGAGGGPGQVDQQLGQALGVDLPAHVRDAELARRRHGRPCRAGPDARVVVDAEEVQRLADDREVARLDVARIVRDARVQRVAALEDRLHVP